MSSLVRCLLQLQLPRSHHAAAATVAATAATAAARRSGGIPCRRYIATFTTTLMCSKNTLTVGRAPATLLLQRHAATRAALAHRPLAQQAQAQAVSLTVRRAAKTAAVTSATLLLPPAALHWLHASALCDAAAAAATLSPTATPPPGAAVAAAERHNPLLRLLAALRDLVYWTIYTLRAALHVAHVTALFSTTVLLRPLVWIGLREQWWAFFFWAIQRSGPAYIKFVQWASTRNDLFSDEFCDRAKAMHSNARKHSWAHTEEALVVAFGKDWHTFIQLDPTPIGSGCVAQVYRAQLQLPGQKPRPVAIKVIHPFVKDMILLDLTCMETFTWMLDKISYFHWMSIYDSITEFAVIMKNQLDMRVEARNLQRFRENFKDVPNVIFPEPITQLCNETVLVEDYIQGKHISHFLDYDTKSKKALAKVAVDAFFKMLLTDNFVHGDLHPGNIIVPDGTDLHHPRLCFIDVGIVTELPKTYKKNFAELFLAISLNHGREAAEMMIDRAREQRCIDREGFVSNIAEIVSAAHQKVMSLKTLHLGALLSRVLSLASQYRVKIESGYTSVIISIAVLEGLGRALNDELDLVKTVLPILLKQRLRGEIYVKDD
eukprot:m.191590 g.191590  ORF g.191590 m.191590 type:complete len:603 (+) comp17571_c1_seq1:71-1879(+)